MSHYVHCPYCGEDGRDVDTGICGCDEEKVAEAKAKAHAEAMEAVVEAARKVAKTPRYAARFLDRQHDLGLALAVLDAARRG